MIGSSVGPYLVVQEIGSGAMGEVYLATDERLGRKVALKSLRGRDLASPATRKRLLHEARTAARLNHPNIAAIYDVIDARERSCIVMEYVEGETLSDRIKRGRVPVDEALYIGSQICAALTEAHSHGVIHRDLKPANIRLTPDGKVKVLDFGLAKVKELTIDGLRVSSLNTAASMETAKIVGTPSYMSPEQLLAKDVDQRTDIYSLGVVLFELLTGRPPFQRGNLMDHAMAVLTQPAPLICTIDPALPAELNRIVARAMARDAQDRYSSASELSRDLGRTLAAVPDGLEEVAQETGEPVATIPSSSSRRLWPRTAALVFTAIALFLAAFLYYPKPWREHLPPTAAGRPPIVIVLPFSNLSGDPAKAYIGAGIAASLTNSLARLPGVGIVAGGVVEEYVRKRGRNPTRIAKDLDATIVVDGGVQESGGRIHLTASLVRPDGSIEWPYDDVAESSEIFPMQTRLAEGVGSHLESQLTETSRRLLAKPLTGNLDAFQDYSKGRAYLERLDVAGNITNAIKHFRNAVESDPGFAAAHAGLGEAYWQQYQETKKAQWVDKAKESIYEALRLDPDQSAVRVSLAQLLKGTGRPDDAMAELRSVIKSQPKNDDAHRLAGKILSDKGNFNAAIDEFNQAISLRPDYWSNHSALASAYYKAGRFDDAASSFYRVTELQPDNAWGFLNLGNTYLLLGDIPRALKNLEKSLAIEPDAYAYGSVGTIHYWEGEYKRAADAYEQAIRLLPNEAWLHRNLGDAYAHLGQPKEATASYTEAVRLSLEQVRVNARDAGVLAKLALYEAKLGRMDDAKHHASQALKLQPKDKDVLYCRAVVHCLAGQNSDAITMLKLALEHGYSSFEMKRDDDLAVLRSMPAFQSLFASNR